MNSEEYYFTNFPFAELRSQDGLSRLCFCSHGYEFPSIQKGDDADWHKNYFMLTLPAFRSEINTVIYQGRDINLLIKELREFSNLRKENVSFEPIEHPRMGVDDL